MTRTMRRPRVVHALLISVLAVCMLSMRAEALVFRARGNAPIKDQGWPTGALQVANLATRTGYVLGPAFGGGQYLFEYRCTETGQFSEALAAFSCILAPRLELVVMDAVEGDLAPEEGRVDWDLALWVPAAFYRFWREFGREKDLGDDPYHRLPPPRMTVYVGGASPIDWGKINIPANVTVIDKRVAASEWKDSRGGVVRITVYDMGSGKVVAGATASLVQWRTEATGRPASGQTDAQGVVVLRDVGKGTYEVRLTHPGYATRSLGYYRNNGRTLETYHAALAPQASLSGVVVDIEGRPLSGARVAASEASGMDGRDYNVPEATALTDRDGRFEIAALPAGRVRRLWVRKEGYHQGPGMEANTPSADVQVTLRHAGIIRGRVGGLGRRSAGQELHVLLDPEGDPLGKFGGSMTCKPDGSFEFRDVPAGRYLLRPAIYPATEGENERQPKRILDFLPGRAGAVLEIDLQLAATQARADGYEDGLKALGGARWKKQDAFHPHLTWYALADAVALADDDEKTIDRFAGLFGYEQLQANSIAFDPKRVWLGTDKGLMAYDRKGQFWARVAVGGTMIEADVTGVDIGADGKLRVTVDEKGKERRFEYDLGAKKWSALPG